MLIDPRAWREAAVSTPTIRGGVDVKHARLVAVALNVMAALGSCSLPGFFGTGDLVGWYTNPRYDTPT